MTMTEAELVILFPTLKMFFSDDITLEATIQNNF